MGDARREYRLLSNHERQLLFTKIINKNFKKEGKNGIEKGKRARRLITSSVAFSVAFLMCFIYYCLIYGSLYNEGVLQIHGCWVPTLS